MNFPLFSKARKPRRKTLREKPDEVVRTFWRTLERLAPRASGGRPPRAAAVREATKH